MNDHQPTKRPARTGAQRQRELRIKALDLLSGDADAMASAPVSAILEAIAPAFRKGDPFAVADLAAELLRRMDTPHRFSLTWVNPETVTVTAPHEPVTVTKQPEPVTVTRGYPTDIKRLAVKLADEGQPTAEIRAAILAAHGKAPDISNLARLVRQWRAALDSEADHE
jgi:hypothetical protein